ncbi:MAG TPA: acyltransferase [Rhizomicrobium sp.]|nr:acyltransferase [Rhizomicrobium sp.]
MKTGRIAPLDSLRGLAALVVVFHHCLVTFPPFWEVYQHPVKPGLYRLLGNTPLHLFWDGPEFVLVFFTLSGFVLSLPFWGDRPLGYRQFVIRRILRIYPPYLAAVTIGMILMTLLSHGPLTGLSSWTTQFWGHPLDWKTIGDHVFLMASAGNNYIDTPVWSLVVEMHASLVFPLLILAIVRSEALTFAACVVLALFGDWAAMQDPGNHIHPFLTSFATTARFLWLFVVGALMARHRQMLTKAVARVPVVLQLLFLAAALVALNCIWQFGADETWRFVEQVGAIALVASAAFMGWFQRLLDIAPLRWLGKISYSLYLIHFVVLFTVLYAFRPEVTLLRLLIAIPILSIGAAALLYRFVEVPSIAWAHRVSDATGRRLAPRINEAVDAPPP